MTRPSGQKDTGRFYKSTVLKKVKELRICKEWSGVRLIHDNASSHKYDIVIFLPSEKADVVNHPSTLFTWHESVWHLGQTCFSCSLYSFHSEQAEQKSSALEHLCWRTREYSFFRGGVDRTVTWPVPKEDGGTLPACVEILVSLDLFQSTPKFPVLLVLGGCSGVRRVL